MIAATIFGGSATAAAETESTGPTAPTNVRAGVDSQGQVTAIEWDASTGCTGPITYHVYLDGSEIEMSLVSQTSVPVFVTAKSGGVESPPSEATTVCFK